MLELNFSPFPEIRTERLLLRSMEISDGPEMLFLRSDDATMKYIDREKLKTLEEAEQFIQKLKDFTGTNESIMWAISLLDRPDTLIGNICFWRIQLQHYRAELGYMLHPGHWKKGIMKEAIAAAVEYGFNTMKLHSIEARINPDNIASGKVLENNGFTREAYFKEDYYCNGRFIDTAVYSLLAK